MTNLPMYEVHSNVNSLPDDERTKRRLFESMKRECGERGEYAADMLETAAQMLEKAHGISATGGDGRLLHPPGGSRNLRRIN